MRHIWTFIAVVLTVIALCGCKIKVEEKAKNQELVTKTIDAKNITSFNINLYATVFIKQDSVESIKVVATKDAIDRIESTSADNEITILEREGLVNDRKIVLFRNAEKVKIYISAPDITKLSIYGSADVHMEEYNSDSDMEFLISGSGDITAKSINVSNLHIAVYGSGDINVSNVTAKGFYTMVSGSGDVNANLCNVKNTVIDIYGSGDIDYNMKDCDDIQLKVSGAGDITLKGNAKHLTQEINGSGDVNINELKLEE